MRLSTNMIFDQQVRGVTDAQSSWLKAGEQLSTGRRVTNPSDDPIAASRAVVLSQTQARDSQFALARSFANQGLSLEESTLSDVTTAIQSAQSWPTAKTGTAATCLPAMRPTSRRSLKMPAVKSSIAVAATRSLRKSTANAP